MPNMSWILYMFINVTAYILQLQDQGETQSIVTWGEGGGQLGPLFYLLMLGEYGALWNVDGKTEILGRRP
jgi:hypothetical protein